MPGPQLDPEWPEYFLIALEDDPNICRAATKAGVSRATVYNLRRDSPEFAARWDDAIAKAIDTIEANGMRRAAWGARKPVYYRGEVCGHTREHSDALVQFFLKSHKPDQYREHVHQHHEIGEAVIVYLPSNGREEGLDDEADDAGATED